MRLDKSARRNRYSVVGGSGHGERRDGDAGHHQRLGRGLLCFRDADQRKQGGGEDVAGRLCHRRVDGFAHLDRSLDDERKQRDGDAGILQRITGRQRGLGILRILWGRQWATDVDLAVGDRRHRELVLFKLEQQFVIEFQWQNLLELLLF